MNEFYDYYGYMEPSLNEAGFAVFLGIWLVMVLVMMAYSITVYVLQSLGLYSIAKRRGIHHAWLSWIPVGSVWMLGSISDQYQYVAKGKVRSRRKVLLGLNIAMYALMIPFYYVYFMFMAEALAYEEYMTFSDLVAPLMAFLAIALVILVVAIVALVFQYIAYYDLFDSCNPNHSVLFLVLGIIFSFLLPFFVFASRKKDLGMPPRKPAAPAPAVYQPVMPAQPEVPEEATAEEPVEQTEAPAEDPEE